MSRHHHHRHHVHRVPSSTGWKAARTPYPPPSSVKLAVWVLGIFLLGILSNGYLAGMK